MKRINLIAPVGKTGYGVMGYNILRILIERDWHVNLFPRSTETDRSPAEKQLIQFATTNAIFFDYDAPCLNIWHQFDLSHKIGRGKYFAWPVFELDTLDERERHHLGYPDELIVCSEWAKKVCANNEVRTKTHVIPLGVDPLVFNTRNIPNKTKSGNIIFLNIGKWEIRKGHDILADAFNKAFSPQDSVELWLMPFNPFLSKSDNQNWEHMYTDTPLGKVGKIKILPWQNDHKMVAQIMSFANCGVFPSRGEGWNLEILEMMALGKPIIATNYSGHTAFCDSYNAMLIDIDAVELAYDGKWFFEQGSWAKLGQVQIDTLIKHMRLVYELCKRDGQFINDAGIETAKKLTWDNTVNHLEEILA